MSIEKILIVDDEMLVRNFLAETLKRKGMDIMTAENGQKAINILKDNTFDMVFTDMKMPDMTGIDVLRKIKELSPSTIVVVITAFGSIENAVEAMRLGAFNYLIKPFSPDTIEAVIEKAKDHLSLVEENQYLRQQVNTKGGVSELKIVGESSVMKKVLEDVANAAKSNASIFINGESGTGKEVIAHAIHYQSMRSARPFIKVNCAAVPETLIESEFFGHEKGAFTGANYKRIGRFELATTGTLLLDEITEIPLSVQAKLLRALQEHEFERVGGNKVIKVDVRIISTSNRDMREAVEKRCIREDLYYRLNVVPIHIPPLRERKEDIILLAEYFTERMSLENQREPKILTAEAKQKLLQYNWPGNVRELANIIERAIVLNASSKILPENLHIDNPRELSRSTPHTNGNFPTGISLQELEKMAIIETLAAQHNNRTKTAEILGISIRTLRNKLNLYKIPAE